MKELKTKSQMILRIAELSEQNTLLRDELYRKSETEQALQTALEENAELKHRNENLRIALSTYEMPEVVKVLTDYRTGELQLQEKRLNNYRSVLQEIREKIKSLNKDICNNCGWYNTDNCQPNGYVCHDLIEIKNKLNEVLK